MLTRKDAIDLLELLNKAPLGTLPIACDTAADKLLYLSSLCYLSQVFAEPKRYDSLGQKLPSYIRK